MIGRNNTTDDKHFHNDLTVKYAHAKNNKYSLSILFLLPIHPPIGCKHGKIFSELLTMKVPAQGAIVQ